VSEVAPAAEVLVTTKASKPALRYFVTADDSRLIVLNISDPTLPATATRILRDWAAHHPEYLAAVPKTGAVRQDNVRIGQDGLFVGDRKIADRDDVVESIARNDVREIWGPVVARGSVPGAVLGGWIGFAIGVVPGLGGAPSGVAWLSVIGAVVAGGYLGSHWSSHQTEGLVFRAP
jgi:hypothetical protein